MLLAFGSEPKNHEMGIMNFCSAEIGSLKMGRMCVRERCDVMKEKLVIYDLLHDIGYKTSICCCDRCGYKNKNNSWIFSLDYHEMPQRGCSLTSWQMENVYMNLKDQNEIGRSERSLEKQRENDVHSVQNGLQVPVNLMNIRTAWDRHKYCIVIVQQNM
jgi:hypothetical protein